MSDPIIRLEKGIRYVECDPSNLGDSEREIVPEKWDQKLRVIVVRLFFLFFSIFQKTNLLCSKIDLVLCGTKRVQIN